MLHTAENVYKSIGLGIAYNSAEKQTTKRCGIAVVKDIMRFRKYHKIRRNRNRTGTKGIDSGANYVNDKVNSIGGALKSRGKDERSGVNSRSIKEVNKRNQYRKSGGSGCCGSGKDGALFPGCVSIGPV